MDNRYAARCELVNEDREKNIRFSVNFVIHKIVLVYPKEQGATCNFFDNKYSE